MPSGGMGACLESPRRTAPTRSGCGPGPVGERGLDALGEREHRSRRREADCAALDRAVGRALLVRQAGGVQAEKDVVADHGGEHAAAVRDPSAAPAATADRGRASAGSSAAGVPRSGTGGAPGGQDPRRHAGGVAGRRRAVVGPLGAHQDAGFQEGVADGVGVAAGVAVPDGGAAAAAEGEGVRGAVVHGARHAQLVALAAGAAGLPRGARRCRRRSGARRRV